MIILNQYCMYLRKSRIDAEAEERGEGETLARHQRILMELAKKRNIEVTAIYKEIVSGDSLAVRPQMQAMLQAVTEGKFAGVLCMEVERLARGNTIDQGIVAQAFKDSGTLIITPTKTYNPDNEMDEEYFEFSLFMSRREYKTIKRRLQAGRLAAIKEGSYISPTAPYGYRKTHPDSKVHTLEIFPEEAEVVEKIFAMYENGNGSRAIAVELNRLHIPPMKNTLWEPVSVRKILMNPIYAGYLHWYSKDNGEELHKGLHPAIIEPELFQKIQTMRKEKAIPQTTEQQTLKNYYHNLMFCSHCKRQMIRRIISATGREHMLCRRAGCNIVGASFEEVDETLLSTLTSHVEELRTKLHEEGETHTPSKPKTDPSKKIRQELEKIEKQRNKLYDLLEQEVYDSPTFLERMSILNDKKSALQAQLDEITQEKNKPEISLQERIDRLQYVIDHFPTADIEERHALLASIATKIWYTKLSKNCYSTPETELHLDFEFV